MGVPARLVLVTFVSIIVMLGAYALFTHECTMAVAGSAATVTVRGLRSEEGCDAMRAGPTPVYRLTTTTPRSPVVCEVQWQGVRYIVRDEGVLKAVGTALCNNLLKAGGSF